MRFLRVSPVQLGQRMSGDLLSRFSADVTAVETAAIYAVGAWIRDGLTVLVLAAVAVALDWRLALVALAVVPVAARPGGSPHPLGAAAHPRGPGPAGGMAGQLREALAAVRHGAGLRRRAGRGGALRGAGRCPRQDALPRGLGPGRGPGAHRGARRRRHRRGAGLGGLGRRPIPPSACSPSSPRWCSSTSRPRSWAGPRSSPPRARPRRSASWRCSTSGRW